MPNDQAANDPTKTSPPPIAQPVFNIAKQFVVPILSGTRKECKVRFPTDSEWCERARKQRSVRRFLGRGKSESQDLNSDAINAELFERIRVDKDGQPFDAAESANVLAKLERAVVDDCDREGDNFRIALKVPGAITGHLLRMPTREETDRYEAASVKIYGARRSQEIRAFLEPSGEFYDLLAKESSGYDGMVPIVHKVTVIGELLAQVTADDEDAIPEV